MCHSQKKATLAKFDMYKSLSSFPRPLLSVRHGTKFLVDIVMGEIKYWRSRNRRWVSISALVDVLVDYFGYMYSLIQLSVSKCNFHRHLMFYNISISKQTCNSFDNQLSLSFYVSHLTFQICNGHWCNIPYINHPGYQRTMTRMRAVQARHTWCPVIFLTQPPPHLVPTITSPAVVWMTL